MPDNFLFRDSSAEGTNDIVAPEFIPVMHAYPNRSLAEAQSILDVETRLIASLHPKSIAATASDESFRSLFPGLKPRATISFMPTAFNSNVRRHWIHYSKVFSPKITILKQIKATWKLAPLSRHCPWP